MNQSAGTAFDEERRSKRPPLSVIVASAHSVQDLQVFLDCVSEQTAGRQVELIVADSREESYSLEVLESKYPDVIFLKFEGLISLPRLWARGIIRSRGDIIAITDSTSPPDGCWVDAVIEAHRSSHPVIGGAVELGDACGLVGLAAYFCEYGQFMRPIAEGVARELPGNNISFKRSVLDTAPEHVTDAFWKTLWCRSLQEKGVELFSTPSIVVRYKRTFRFLPFTARRFHHGRCFGAMRIGRASVAMRALYAAGSCLLPFVFFFRIVRVVVLKRRHIGEFAMSLPVSLTAIVSWSLGEFCGYIAGPGRSCARVR